MDYNFKIINIVFLVLVITGCQMFSADLLILTGFSGGGKSTTLSNLLSKHPGALKNLVFYTTRAPRQGEVDGQDYYFVSLEKFEEISDAGMFINQSTYENKHGGILMYGVPRFFGKHVVALGIDAAISLKKIFKEKSLLVFAGCHLDQSNENLANRAADGDGFLSQRQENNRSFYHQFLQNKDLFDIDLRGVSQEDTPTKLEQILKSRNFLH